MAITIEIWYQNVCKNEYEYDEYYYLTENIYIYAAANNIR